MLSNVMEGVVVVLALIGAYMNARAIRSGFYVWFLANLLGSIFFISQGLYGMAGLYLVFGVFNIYGLAVWCYQGT
jgi:nicotinamide riboside transporter PnuC